MLRMSNNNVHRREKLLSYIGTSYTGIELMIVGEIIS